ncbi:MAG: hypothetical protein IPM54_19650 [Polyangiaceae bacterium]|nr:hypothetical protein [Polyangiaceae bacterium]
MMSRCTTPCAASTASARATAAAYASAYFEWQAVRGEDRFRASCRREFAHDAEQLGMFDEPDRAWCDGVTELFPSAWARRKRARSSLGAHARAFDEHRGAILETSSVEGEAGICGEGGDDATAGEFGVMRFDSANAGTRHERYGVRAGQWKG